MIRVLQWRIGLSGDGVTRSVLNACRELPAEEFENVYITGEQDTGACARLIGGPPPGENAADETMETRAATALGRLLLSGGRRPLYPVLR